LRVISPPARPHARPLAALTASLLSLCALSVPAGEGPALAQPKPDFTPNLPLVLLDAAQSIGASTLVPVTVRVVPPGTPVAAAPQTLAARVRVRGASSQRYEKKSYAITLDQPARLLDLREDQNWILQAAYVDRSLMRHKLSYDLFAALATPEAPRYAARSRFVEVYLNGRYRGVYLLMERVDGPLLRMRGYHASDAAHACLYKAVDHAANFDQSGHEGYEQFEPNPATRAYWKPLEEFNQFISTASDAEFFAPDTGIAARLDLANAMDFHLLVLLTSNSDGITKNYYFGRDGQASGPVKQRWFFAPWDYDATFGRNWDGWPYPHNHWLSNHLFDRLMRQESYRRQFAARWQALRQGVYSTASVRRRMDDNVRTLGEAVRRNIARWPTIGGDYPDELTFEQDLAQMKTWIEKRGQWLDAEIARRASAAGRR
jgi:spore coat protein H